MSDDLLQVLKEYQCRDDVACRFVQLGGPNSDWLGSNTGRLRLWDASPTVHIVVVVANFEYDRVEERNPSLIVVVPKESRNQPRHLSSVQVHLQHDQTNGTLFQPICMPREPETLVELTSNKSNGLKMYVFKDMRYKSLDIDHVATNMIFPKATKWLAACC